MIDWLSRPIADGIAQVLEGKLAAISGITPGMTGMSVAQNHLITLLSFLNMDIMNKPRLTILTVYQQLDKFGELSWLYN